MQFAYTVCELFQETRRMSQVTPSHESRLNVIFKKKSKCVFCPEMTSGTCELSCALITNLYAICKYEYNCLIMSLVGLATENDSNLPASHDWLR